LDHPLQKKNLTASKVNITTIAKQFSPVEKIGEEMGWPHCKRLVKIGKKDWKKD